MNVTKEQQTNELNLSKKDGKHLVEKTKNKTILCEDPLIYTVDNYLTKDECDYFIKLSKNKLRRALVSLQKAGNISNGRTGSNCWISHDLSEKTKMVGEKIANLVNHPLENAEKFQIIHYNKTQEYRMHYDSWKHDYSEKSLRCIRFGGSRLLTVLCYLNNVEEGGGTNFSKLDITVKAKQGRILVFENTFKNNHNRHPLSQHAGMPVLNGEKYAFNLWFRECPRKMLYKTYNPEYYKKVELKEKKNLKYQNLFRIK